MATANDRLGLFQERLNEMGIRSNVNLHLVSEDKEEDTLTFKLEIVNKNAPINSELLNHAVMGLIAHFQNRKWIKGWNYTYIMKYLHHITFTNKSD
jgi:hypothetical protein